MTGATNLIQPEDLYGMVSHWLNTPAGAYFGSSYGNPIKGTLQRPMSDTNADEVLEKMVADLPLLSTLPAGTVNIYAFAHPDFVDRTELAVEVGGELIEVPRN